MVKPALIAVLVAAVFSSCSTPTPVPPAADPRSGAPIPSAPRDVRPASLAPCENLLSSAEWEALGFSPAGTSRITATGERSCRWVGPSDERFISVIAFPDRDPLVMRYTARQFSVFQPSSTGGLPSTREQASQESFSCTLTVGTAEGQGFVVTYDDRTLGRDQRPGGPCARAQEIAERIVAALPPLPGK